MEYIRIPPSSGIYIALSPFFPVVHSLTVKLVLDRFNLFSIISVSKLAIPSLKCWY